MAKLNMKDFEIVTPNPKPTATPLNMDDYEVVGKSQNLKNHGAGGSWGTPIKQNEKAPFDPFGSLYNAAQVGAGDFNTGLAKLIESPVNAVITGINTVNPRANIPEWNPLSSFTRQQAEPYQQKLNVLAQNPANQGYQIAGTMLSQIPQDISLLAGNEAALGSIVSKTPWLAKLGPELQHFVKSVVTAPGYTVSKTAISEGRLPTAEEYGKDLAFFGAAPLGGKMAAKGFEKLLPNAPKIIQGAVKGAGEGMAGLTATYPLVSDEEKQKFGEQYGPTAISMAAMGALGGVKGDFNKVPNIKKTETVETQPIQTEEYTGPERRTNTFLRQVMDKMTPEEMQQALFTHQRTGMLNKSAFETVLNTPELRKPVITKYDADSLKWWNDNLGEKAGDELLKTIANAFKKSGHGENSFHTGGDEFYAQFDTPESAQKINAQIENILKDAIIEVRNPDGTVRRFKGGVGLSYGYGENPETADTAMQQNKLSREQSGLRASRGNQPPGLVELTQGTGIDTTRGGNQSNITGVSEPSQNEAVLNLSRNPLPNGELTNTRNSPQEVVPNRQDNSVSKTTPGTNNRYAYEGSQPIDTGRQTRPENLATDQQIKPSRKEVVSVSPKSQEYLSKSGLTADDAYIAFEAKKNGRKWFENQYKDIPDPGKVFDDLVSKVDKLTPQQQNKIKFDLQFFAMREQDVNKKVNEQFISRFRTNSIERAVNIPADIKEKLLVEDYGYEPESSREWLSNAKQNIATDKQKVIDRLMNTRAMLGGEQTAEAITLIEQMTKEVKTDADISNLNKFTQEVASKIRESARALKSVDTSLEKYGSPESAIIEGQRVVKKAQEEIENKNPVKKERIKKDAEKVKEAVNEAKKRTAKQITEEDLYKMLNRKLEAENKPKKERQQQQESPDQKLADRIIQAIKPPKNLTTEEQAEAEMLRALFAVAKESPLPKYPNREPMNPIDQMKDLINNREKYKTVYDKALKLVGQKFSGNEKMMQLSYEFIHNKPWTLISNKMLDNVARETAKTLDIKLSEVVKQLPSDKVEAVRKITEFIMNETEVTKSPEEAGYVAEMLYNKLNTDLKTTAQKTLNAMFKDRPEPVRKSLTQKVLELINLGAYDDSAIVNILREKEGMPVLTNDDVKFIIDKMEFAKTLPEGSDQHRITIGQVQRRIADKIPASLRDKFRGLQRVSMLTNPKTLITRNPGSNVLWGGVSGLEENTLGAIVDKITSAVRGSERTTIFDPIGKSKAYGEGTAKGFKEWFQDIGGGWENYKKLPKNATMQQRIEAYKNDRMNAVDTSPSRGQLELPSGRTFQNETLNAIDNFVRNSLQLGDRPFYQGAYDSRLYELKKIRKTDTVTPEMEVEARLYALDKVFQNNSVLSKKAGELRRALGWVGDVAIPFTQTPANVLDKLLDHTPVGLGKVIYHGFKTAGKGTFNQKYFTDTLTRFLSGSGIMLFGYALASKGLITGEKDKNKRVASFKQNIGVSQYAFRFGNSFYTYDWMQPVGGMLAAGADAFYGGQGKKDFIQKLTTGMISAGDTIFNQSFVQGLLKLMGGYSPTTNIAKTIIETPTQFTPTAGKQVAQLFDPYIRNTADKNLFVQTGKKIVSKVPGASMLLPPKLDQYGQPIKAFQGKNNLWNVALNPGFQTTIDKSPANKLIMDVYNNTGEAEVIPKNAPQEITIDKEKYSLTIDEQAKFQKTMGKRVLAQLNQLALNGRKLSYEEKARRIREIINTAYDEAKDEFMKQKGIRRNPKASSWGSTKW